MLCLMNEIVLLIVNTCSGQWYKSYDANLKQNVYKKQIKINILFLLIKQFVYAFYLKCSNDATRGADDGF